MVKGYFEDGFTVYWNLSKQPNSPYGASKQPNVGKHLLSKRKLLFQEPKMLAACDWLISPLRVPTSVHLAHSYSTYFLP